MSNKQARYVGNLRYVVDIARFECYQGERSLQYLINYSNYLG
jgi:hypothetical protein